MAEKKTQSTAPVKAEAEATNTDGKDLVEFEVELHNGRKVTVEMFRDPMDAGFEVVQFAEQNQMFSYVSGLLTAKSRFELKNLGANGHDLASTVFEAYQEAIEVGED